MLYREIDAKGLKHVFANLEEEYDLAEKVIPTKFAKFENKLSEEYRKIKNNFYMLWEAAENLKKSFFDRDDRLRTRFGIIKNYEHRNDFHMTELKAWNLHVVEGGIFRSVSDFPDITVTIREIEKILKIDIYAMLRKFLETYYYEGLLFEYSLIKLSGQSTKISMFQEVLKEFVPGKMIEFKSMADVNDLELKLNCLDGVIKYLDYRRFGHIDVDIQNEIPLVPYSVWGETYDKQLVKLIKTSRNLDDNRGYIDKTMSAIELKLFLHNVEDELKKELIYKNALDEYEELDAEVVIERFNGIITQDDTDTIINYNVRFFVFTDENSWGFYVWPVQRQGDQLFLGKKKYYPFEDDLNEISFFDGEH